MRKWQTLALFAFATVSSADAGWDVEVPAFCGAVTRLHVEALPFAIAADGNGGFVPRVAGGQHALEAGQPDLPFLVRLIPIPRACTARLEIVEISRLETNTPEVKPVARHEAREDDEGRRWVEHVPGERGPVYVQDAFWPPDAISITYASQGTQRWARIVFHPLQYNPIRGILRWNKSIEARLHWQAEPATP
jgi:hypothetical protein